jgi:RNA ligase
MHLYELVPQKVLSEAIDDDFVKCIGHPRGKLRLYNYTPRASLHRVWNAATLQCRALITDWDGNIVARGFEKFFEVGLPSLPETLPENFPEDEPEILDKLDGWHGVAYEHDGLRGIATKGSFVSEVALIATGIYNSKYPKSNWPSGYTPVFEIIHPKTQMVVKYDFTDLVLVALVHTKTGHHMTWKELIGYAEDNRMRSVDQLFCVKLSDVMKESIQNKEGYVFKWHLGDCPPLMVKWRFPTYVQAYNIIRNFDAKTIWAMLKQKQEIDGFVKAKFIPPYFQEWTKKTAEHLQKRAKDLEREAWNLIDDCPMPPTNHKLVSRWLLEQTPNRPQMAMLCFKMLSGKDYHEKLWDLIMPEPTRLQEI